MENLNLILFIGIVIPLGLMLLIFDGKARTDLIFLILGLTVCLFCGELSAILARFIPFSFRFLTTNLTPVTEEVFKALPILFYAFLYKPKRRELLEASIAVGVGFAILENAFLLAGNLPAVSVTTGILRGLGAGTMHAQTTLAVGVGMSFIHTRRKLFLTGTVALLSVAIVFHSVYNNIVSTPHGSWGVLLPISLFIPLVYVLKKKNLI